jgi:hypothetical protein
MASSVALQYPVVSHLKNSSDDLKISNEFNDYVRRVVIEELKNDENIRKIFQEQSEVQKYKTIDNLGFSITLCSFVLGLLWILRK